MSQQLTVELQDPEFQVLKEVADGLGKDPSEIGAEWLAAALERVVKDPLYRFAGAFRSGMPGWVDRHDEHLGAALLKEMRGGDAQ